MDYIITESGVTPIIHPWTKRQEEDVNSYKSSCILDVIPLYGEGHNPFISRKLIRVGNYLRFAEGPKEYMRDQAIGVVIFFRNSLYDTTVETPDEDIYIELPHNTDREKVSVLYNAIVNTLIKNSRCFDLRSAMLGQYRIMHWHGGKLINDSAWIGDMREKIDVWFENKFTE